MLFDNWSLGQIDVVVELLLLLFFDIMQEGSSSGYGFAQLSLQEASFPETSCSGQVLG
jgi:hypothetical protein